MAPISKRISRPANVYLTIDDERLFSLLQTFNTINCVPISATIVSDNVPLPSDIVTLCTILEPWCKEWLFEEQVDLHEWISALNAMDAALTWILKNRGSNIILVPAVTKSKDDVTPDAATSLEQIDECPAIVIDHLNIILQFTTVLLRNSTNKSVYVSVPAINHLLGSASETVYENALSVLAALSVPPILHKQQSPESSSSHATVLHHAEKDSEVHARLTATARAWGTRANGLGLYTTVTTDDSLTGQGLLPIAIGEVSYCYYQNIVDTASGEKVGDTSMECSNLQEISLSLEEMIIDESGILAMTDDSNDDDDDNGEYQVARNKRRKVSFPSLREKVRSTEQLFFQALEKTGGRQSIPPDRLFYLLAEIRLARSFHTQASRIRAIRRRLLALISILQYHPSQEIMSGYFQAQPELAAELVDLLRPTVDVVNVSSIGHDVPMLNTRLRLDTLSVLVNDVTQSVPYDIRILSLEALTALVARRDSTGGITGYPRASNVLLELGVCKGQYLGILPTLIRTALAAISVSPEHRLDIIETEQQPVPETLEIGLAFAEAAMPPQMPRREQVEKCLLFIDAVLSLTSAVISAPSGTSALVDCGLVSSLLATISINIPNAMALLLPNEAHDRRLYSLFRFVAAQAVQILEGTVVSYNNALTEFHDLQGVEILTMRLTTEIAEAKSSSQSVCDDKNEPNDEDTQMEDAKNISKPIVSSQRVLLYGIVTCLTVIFHQDTSSVTVPAGGAQLRKKELTNAILEILNQVQLYGGYLAYLVSTLLSDILNNDQHLVEYVHQSGIATAFLNMFKETRLDGNDHSLSIPPVPELVMGIPNVLLALSLTEYGAQAVYDANPFPEFLRIFYNPDYAMPNSHCLSHEMTTIVGTGLDEITRHVDKLKPLILKALADAIGHVSKYAETLEGLEAVDQLPLRTNELTTTLEYKRSYLIQYVLNFGQLLDQILSNEEHCDPFVEAGGLKSLLHLLPHSLPPDSQFLAFLTCLSAPSASTLFHSTTEDTVSQVLKAIELRYDPLELIRLLVTQAKLYLNEADDNQRKLLETNGREYILDGIPNIPVCKLSETDVLSNVAAFLKSCTKVQWITTVLANAIKAANQRSSESGSSWSRIEREWEKELSSQAFEGFVDRISTFYRSSIFEVCRARTQPDFERMDNILQRHRAVGIRYRLRIVCSEGAVVRDGIEIDPCLNVGRMEIGDVIESFDRCINSSGVLRYRTEMGWVSELTRGHGREPIAEVISVYESTEDLPEDYSRNCTTRIESGLSSLRQVAISVLARGQPCYTDFFGSLSKLAIQGVRSIPGRAITFEEGSQGLHVASLTKLLSANVKNAFGHPKITPFVRNMEDTETAQDISKSGVALYFGFYFEHLHTCLFEEKRESRLVNFTLLVSLLSNNSQANCSVPGLFDAIRFVFQQGLSDFAARNIPVIVSGSMESVLRVDRTVAASYPPLLALLKKLLSAPFSASPAASIMSRMISEDVARLIGETEINLASTASTSDTFFSPERCVTELHESVSIAVRDLWTDPRIVLAPPFLIHPIATLVDDIITSLQDAPKKKLNGSTITSSFQRQAERIRLSELTRRPPDELFLEESFVPSEDIISQLIEMGFTRDHAIDALESTRSNRIESAMDYALSNPPPSVAMVERRSARRRERTVRRAAILPVVQETSASVVDQENNNDQMESNEGTVSDKDKEIRSKETARSKKDASLSSWLDIAISVSCSFLTSMRTGINGNIIPRGNETTAQDGNGENEALTVVLCSFLLDLCHKFPDKRNMIVSCVFSSLKKKLNDVREDSFEGSLAWDTSSEASIAALCHASVLLSRALPKTRLLILKEGLVRTLLSHIERILRVFEIQGSKEPFSFPLWLAPSLLLLDIMAQPIVAFGDKELVQNIQNDTPDVEFTEVFDYHKQEVDDLIRIAHGLFSPKEDRNGTESKVEEKSSTLESMDVESRGKDSNDETSISPFSSIPAYFPLLTTEMSECCQDVCHKLLSLTRLEGGSVVLPPGIAHGMLLLLLRLLRNPKSSSRFLQMGFVDTILALPKASSFIGKTGLVTSVFRRLLEDEATLQSTMEAEIRGAITRLAAKKNSSSNDSKPSVPLSTFMESVTPLLTRNPFLFLRAFMLSVALEHDTAKKECKVSMLSAEERSKKSSIMAESLATLIDRESFAHDTKEGVSRNKRHSSGSKAKTKSSQKVSKRQSLTPKKHKREKSDSFSHVVCESPAVSITALIINAIVASRDLLHLDREAFLGTGSLLEILADLILAVPACASAVHNYRPPRSKDKTKKISGLLSTCHALTACPAPPKTFVTFLIHSVLPQNRWLMRNDPKVWGSKKDEAVDNAKESQEKRKKAYTTMKLSQAAGRVLIALGIRVGEGRKKVIADLVYGLSGGLLGHGSVQTPASLDGLSTEAAYRELEAILTWGELCLGLMTPRSNGKSLDNIISFSIDNLRLMLDCGMVHSLLFALQRVSLFHPMASGVCSALLTPLEILTRPAVTDAVRELIAKDNSPKEIMQDECKSVHGTATGDSSSFVETPFDGPTDLQELETVDDEVDDEDDETVDDSSDESGDQFDDDDDGEDETDGDEMNDDEDQSEMEEDEDESSEDVEEEADYEVDHNDNFPLGTGAGRHEPEEAGDEGTDHFEEMFDDGWTRIESGGFSGGLPMVIGNTLPVMMARRSVPFSGPPTRNIGIVDVAQSMFSSLVQRGRMTGEDIADLEDTLGIRIVSGGVLSGGDPSFTNWRNGAELGGLRVLGMDGHRGSERERERNFESFGTLPHIHQRSQPEVGYAAYGRGQWIEISSMEYVYGGPSVTGVSRNYDAHSPFPDDSESESSVALNQYDLMLFPSGPAAAASPRTQHALHPLLCGVDLPPINSVISDLLPHGVRATRPGQMTTRRPGDLSSALFSTITGGYLVSTSNGNIMRSSRQQSGGPRGIVPSVRNIMGPVGWTDDGIQVDSTLGDFGSAFERALNEAAQRAASSEESIAATTSDSPLIIETIGQTLELSHGDNNEVLVTSATSAPHLGVTAGSQVLGEEQESVGERVATSLAESLRLSPGTSSDGSVHSENPDTTRTDTNPTAVLAAANTSEVPILESGSIDSRFMQSVDDIVVDMDTSIAPETLMEETGQPPFDNVTSPSLVIPVLELNSDDTATANGNGLICPPNIDAEVFNSLPLEMQQDCIDEYNSSLALAAELDGSSLDPAFVAELPPEMRRELIEQDRRERQQRVQETPIADPARAEDLDIASFIATLQNPLREEVLLTAEESVLNSLPPVIQAEARVLRERASLQQRGISIGGVMGLPLATGNLRPGTQQSNGVDSSGQLNRKRRPGRIRVDVDRASVLYTPDGLSPAFAKSDFSTLFSLFYLISPLRPPRLQQKLLQNICANATYRTAVVTTFLMLLHDDGPGAREAVGAITSQYGTDDKWRLLVDSLSADAIEFPPNGLLGAVLDVPHSKNMSSSVVRRKEGLEAAAAFASSLPKSATASNNDSCLPIVVASRLIEAIQQMCKASTRFCLHVLITPSHKSGVPATSTCFEKLLELLEKPMYSKSATNLDNLLSVLESAVSPLSHISKQSDEEVELTTREIDAADSAGKEWVDVPRIVVSQPSLQLLCSILRMDACRDTAFSKVNTIVRRLCRVEQNRGFVLTELASVAHALGGDAIRDLRALRIRMESIAIQPSKKQDEKMDGGDKQGIQSNMLPTIRGTISSSVSVSTSTSELKLLRVLQTLQALCSDNSDEKKNEGSVLVTDDLVDLLRQMEFDELWKELTSCLKVVQVIEGVHTLEEEQKTPENQDANDEASGSDTGEKAKKLRNSAAGLLTRFLPAIEAFFVANASATRNTESGKDLDSGDRKDDVTFDNLVGGHRVLEFAVSNKVLLNALVRNNPALLEKGLRALVQVPRCRPLLDFDVKRHWFKTQMRRMRQHAARRNSSLRLVIRRNHVFEDTYLQLRVRNADEMRGRLHITFRNEEGVDAGGLSREFFGILAKEMFNPNYALFTSTEDGCTFQPNPNSSINQDHLSYFRFVGQIVGKAVADSFLLDAHFTRSLYKHMLGLTPSYHDMEAIDPDYYRNLTTILQYNLEEFGLGDLTFCIQDNSFGRHQVIDLIPNGRTIPVTEENKEKYVDLVCQHRMTTAIQSQIKAYLDGFYELVNRDLIAVFTPRELELLISGMPEIDLNDLRKNTDYVGWKSTDKEIQWFWNVLFELTANEKAAFLQFVTGSSKVPLAGFSELQGMRGVQKFSIHRAGMNGALMSAHTCFNSLDLPIYETEDEMRKKLLYSITEGGGAFHFA